MKVVLTCRCQRRADITGDDALVVVRLARHHGWCASEDDLETFAMTGRLPAMACCIECWKNQELATAYHLRPDRMLPLPPWSQYIGMP